MDTLKIELHGVLIHKLIVAKLSKDTSYPLHVPDKFKSALYTLRV
jgi:hypothetical protein